MSSHRKAFIIGAFEHPLRAMPDRSDHQIHAEVAVGALKDAGLSLQDVDSYYCSGELSTGHGITEYLGLRLSTIDTTSVGGSSPLVQIGHAVAKIATGKSRVALLTLAARARSGRPTPGQRSPEADFELPFGPNTVGLYALAARRHMHEFGTTAEQLAEIKVAASHHAQFNPQAVLREPVTVEEVLASPMMSDPIHRLECCLVTDGGGAVVVVSPEVARDLPRRKAKILGTGVSLKHTFNGRVDLTYTAARWSGPQAFAEAGVTPFDIKYASIYDSFTITVLETLEDLGFCAKGAGGRFVLDRALWAPHGRLPINTDGGGLCSNHPGRGGMSRLIEAVRQVRGEANPEVQVPNSTLALAHGTGGLLGHRHASATVILGQEDA